MVKKVLITGITGQDAYYLANLLLSKDYEIHGTTRSIQRAKSLLKNKLPYDVCIHEWDLVDEFSLHKLISKINPNEIYNLAANTAGDEMYKNPSGLGLINGLSVTKLLEAIRTIDPSIRFLQASSSEMFGNAITSPQSEVDLFRPRNPYGISKLYAHLMMGVYRKHYGMFCCSAILYNHESPMRPANFVTRKISQTVAKIKKNKADKLVLGNLDVSRDWMHASDAVEAMWLMMQHSCPDDYIVATGERNTVRDFCDLAFSYVGMKYTDYVMSSLEYYRPSENISLIGNASKIKKIGWIPKITFKNLVQEMVQHDLKLLESNTHRTQR
jgi:GDPmannose 4,6-dehydratase